MLLRGLEGQGRAGEDEENRVSRGLLERKRDGRGGEEVSRPGGAGMSLGEGLKHCPAPNSA